MKTGKKNFMKVGALTHTHKCIIIIIIIIIEKWGRKRVIEASFAFFIFLFFIFFKRQHPFPLAKQTMVFLEGVLVRLAI